jgi:3,5-epimerase/4-reductase
MTARVLLYGAAGWIGGKMERLLRDRGLEVHVGKARLDDLDALRLEMLHRDPTHVISTAGRTHGTTADGRVWSTIDFLEQKPDGLRLNVRDNLMGPVHLAELGKRLGVHVTYLGTGCIFENDAGDLEACDGFDENDDGNFCGSGYSTVKGATDRLFRLLYDDTALNARIRMPITDEVHPRNFITKIVNYERVCSVPNSMTVLDELLPVLADLALERRTGTINLVNPGVISHNEILEMYRDIVDPSFEWRNFSLEEQSLVLAAGRSNCRLDSSKLQRWAAVNPIRDAVRAALLRMRDAGPSFADRSVQLLPAGGATAGACHCSECSCCGAAHCRDFCECEHCDCRR